jgi:hypothetical protein
VSAQFSVFIPVWNDQAWLPGAIESVLAQTYPDWELVVGDNASDDDLAALVGRYPDPRVRYHRWPRHVPTYENYNRTMLLTRCDWAQLLCADDRLHPRCLEQMAAVLGAQDSRAERVAMVLTACRRVDEHAQPAEGLYYGSNRVQSIPAGRYDAAAWLRAAASPGMPAWNFGSVAISREVIAEMGCFFRPEVGLCSDFDLALRAAAYGDVLFLDEPLLDFTVRAGSDGNARFRRNRERGEARTVIGTAFLSALELHAARRAVDPQERAEVLAAVSRSHLQRAGQHRLLPGGRGRWAALLDVLRAARYSPRTVLEPMSLLTALGAIGAPRPAIAWASRRLRARHAARERMAAGQASAS